MSSSQTFIHWLEQDRGAKWLLGAAVGVLALALTLRYSWRQFHGLPTEFVLQQAVIGRQVARGEGFTTLVNYPQTYAVLRAQGRPFDEHKAYPDLHHAPLYPLVLAAGFALLPQSAWHARPQAPGGETLDGW